MSSHQESVPQVTDIESLFKTFSRNKWIVFWISLFVFVGTAFALLYSLNQKILVGIPAHGGGHTEGVVGTPRFINPLLALSDADKDLVAVVYSGLMRRDTNGELVPDLAENYTVSPDGLTYTFAIKKNAYFQNNTKVTAEDVVYTINEAKDPLIKSPKKVNWDGVTATAQDTETVVFTLKQRYASFLDNTTLGILPSKSWQNLSEDQFSLTKLNSSPIGSGPFEIGKITNDGSGIPTSYDLKPFNKFVSGKPYLDRLTFRFYTNETELVNAFRSGAVNAINSISSDKALELSKQGYHVDTTILPRMFGLYFNQSQNKLFTDSRVAQALELALSKKDIIDNVLNGYGAPIDSPIPAMLLGQTPGKDVADQNIDQATNILTAAGWSKDENNHWIKKQGTGKKATTIALSFSISTSDTPELKDAANAIKDSLNAFGAQVDVKVFEMGALNQNVIRPRKFEALFFGTIINHDTDLFAFWHSSQRTDPGLNIASYASARADKDLEGASSTLDTAKRLQLDQAFEQEVAKDKPAVFIYSPAFIYATNDTISNVSLGQVTTESDRLGNVWQWYQNKDYVWPFFAKNN
jgi:peptide/nickel transport system substrate-binding protein